MSGCPLRRVLSSPPNLCGKSSGGWRTKQVRKSKRAGRSTTGMVILRQRRVQEAWRNWRFSTTGSAWGLEDELLLDDEEEAELDPTTTNMAVDTFPLVGTILTNKVVNILQIQEIGEKRSKLIVRESLLKRGGRSLL
ncbi:unnamed protein product [Cuscuta europaea]|uniref:Uncharacterized protein n=1 Tax=Cuscuta europaea TaxID=41803 RepID=A0A9P1EGM5_CUSEU|nr:unnamed protein product [Cuscuta europaea]